MTTKRLALVAGLVGGLAGACVPLAGGLVAWGRMDARVGAIEGDVGITRKEIREDLREIRIRVDRILERLPRR